MKAGISRVKVKSEVVVEVAEKDIFQFEVYRECTESKLTNWKTAAEYTGQLTDIAGIRSILDRFDDWACDIKLQAGTDVEGPFVRGNVTAYEEQSLEAAEDILERLEAAVEAFHRTYPEGQFELDLSQTISIRDI